MSEGHDELTLERERLARVRRAMETRTGQLVKQGEGGGISTGDRHAARQVARQRAEERRLLERHSGQPYFGRVDFADEQARLASFYVGKFGMQLAGVQVVDWRAPVAQLYYGGTEREQVYAAPRGPRRVSVSLKRHLDVRAGQLLQLHDDIAAGGQEARPVDQRLRDRLTERKGGPLLDIVTTIQQHQDELIRADAGQVLVINGVAGSGKTTIAFHRLAFLHYEEVVAQEAPNTIVFGPNATFLQHVAGLLPELNVHGVQLTTFEAWALERLNLPRDRGVRDATLEVLLDSAASRQARKEAWLQARVRGSHRMLSLMQRYVTHRSRDLRFASDVSVRVPVGDGEVELRVGVEQLRELHERALELMDVTFERRRQWYSGAVQQTLLREAARELPVHVLASVRAEVTREVRRFVNRVWSRIEPLRDLRGLLGDRALLTRLGRGLFTPGELKALSSVEFADEWVDVVDLPVMLALQLEAFGYDGPTYRHIVVDEAQDFSPLQFALLRRHQDAASMTVVGDIAQGLHAYRGLNQWAELQPALGEFRLVHVVQTYRATREIVEFANRVLERTYRADAVLAVPFDRSGPAVQVQVERDERRQLMQVGSFVQGAQGEEKSIGVITRTAAEAERWSEVLREHLGEWPSGLEVLPVTLAKGLEFDHAVVLGADAVHYDPRVAYDGRLLYVALTRALHSMLVIAAGRPHPLIAHAAAVGA